MKHLLLIFTLSTLPLLSFSQDVIKFRTSSLSTKTTDNYGNWKSWSAWEDVSVLVVLKDDRVTIYSSSTQEYDITEYNGESTDDDGDTVMKIKCVDQDGDMCTLGLIFGEDDAIQLYVDFSNIMWVYNMTRL